MEFTLTKTPVKGGKYEYKVLNICRPDRAKKREARTIRLPAHQRRTIFYGSPHARRLQDEARRVDKEEPIKPGLTSPNNVSK